MAKRIPPDAFEQYHALGPSRAYATLAERYGVSKQAVAKLAVRERWQEQHRVDIMQVPPAHILRNASEVAEAIVDIATRRRARFAG